LYFLTYRSFIYNFWSSPNDAPIGHKGVRWSAADLTSPANITFNDGAVSIGEGAFTDGTFIFLGNNPWKKYSVSGTSLTFVANISGGMANPIAAFYDNDTNHVFMVSSTFEVEEYSVGASSFTLIDSFQYRLPQLGWSSGNDGGSSIYPIGMAALDTGSDMLSFGYRATMKVTNQNSPSPTTSQSDTAILKAFTKPSEI